MSEDKKEINVSVPLNIEGIDEAFARILLESKLGKALEDEIQKVLKGDVFSGRDPIQSAVESVVRILVTKIAKEMLESYEEEIRKILASKITSEYLIDTVGKYWDRVLNS